MWTRRDWMRAAGRAALAVSVPPARAAGAAAGQPGEDLPVRPTFCLFSKPLPELGWSALGKAVRDIGYSGVDLTVRAKGHVLPERVGDDLPQAIDAIGQAGLSVPMITTDITSADAPHARRVLEVAARHGVRYFKTGYWQYRSPDVRADVTRVGSALDGLAALARECGIEMGFHNHAAYVGAALWDVAPTMDRLDARWAGYYFDPRHAVAEVGAGAWKTAAHLVAPRLKMVALKDCVWRKGPGGWAVENCPLGEGLVDWAFVGALLREARFGGPVSIHIEYEVAATTPDERTTSTLEAARRDLAYARRFIG